MSFVSATFSSGLKGAELKYPETRRGEQIDDYHGTKVADPYRWLEEPDSAATRAWVGAQNEVTQRFLGEIPERAVLKERLTKLWNYVRYGTPTVRGNRYFFSRNDGLQNQAVLYVADALDAEPRVLLDPNKLSTEGTVALTGYELSDDGRRMAYGLAAAGSDWQEWKVRDVDTGKDLNDVIRWVKFSGASWTHDGSGFFYSRYDEPAAGAALTGQNYYQKLYFHKLGTPQADDRLVYEREDEKEWGFGGSVTDDGHYLIINVWRGTDPKNQIFYQDLTTPGAKVVQLLNGFTADYSFIGNDGPIFYFRTDLDAPRYCVVSMDIRTPDTLHNVIPPQEGVLEGISLFGDRFIATYMIGARNEVREISLTGLVGNPIELPGIGSVGGFGGRRDAKETFYSFTGFTTPTIIYRYDLTTGKSTVFRKAEVDFQPEDFETKQIFYASRDSTRIPMFITYRKGLKLDGSNPTILYGYGGFNISLTPSFAAGRIAWLEQGGVLAIPNLRGGGEYGRRWHEEGMVERKQNVFDDFIAAAERLIADGYTRPDKLAISGGSNGGLLVGACLTQRPDLFGAAVPDVGVMDMLRFHKFTIGWAWASEYGSSDDAKQFAVLHKYSPLHNLKSGTKYPAVLVTTADHDDRVVPAHSFKFAAALQAAQAGDAPTLIRIETSAGHGAGTPTTKQIEKLADTYAFLSRVLKIERKK
ncbi:MAG: prolyl oligopeptidase family serine peptidase [Planctomycetia bacterium]|nr:prolyl oligopeptidase family serine peptidase [Planctomycetia bacterium]